MHHVCIIFRLLLAASEPPVPRTFRQVQGKGLSTFLRRVTLSQHYAKNSTPQEYHSYPAFIPAPIFRSRL
jgi:hypothetical protein